MKDKNVFGTAAAKHFLCRHWQKKPLLVRDAVAECAELISRKALMQLAARDDVESRLVMRRGANWKAEHGPFSPRTLAALPATGWTLLVQGVNLVMPAADRLLRRFSFIPFARLDDLMVSYAPPGGGVGPHYDSYDVFLLQGMGRRRWEISAQRDLEVVPDAPLRILKTFRATRAWTLGPGDMLYLPPGYAHDGVAETECTTFSIGFRAPQAQELAVGFLEYLQDRLDLRGIYADPGLQPARSAAAIPPAMLKRIGEMLEAVKWSRADVADFAGRFLTEPKQHVVFSRPRKKATPAAFARRTARHGVRLALATLMLHTPGRIYINGETHAVSGRAAQLLARLADDRVLEGQAFDAVTLRQLYAWYAAGYIEMQET
jgi:50S ribosomal protein L16 3-hydroxylase